MNRRTVGIIAALTALVLTTAGACPSPPSEAETKNLTQDQIAAIKGLAPTNETLQAVLAYGAEPVHLNPGKGDDKGSVHFVRECATAGRKDCIVSPFAIPDVTVGLNAGPFKREPNKFEFANNGFVQVAGASTTSDGKESEGFSCILRPGQTLTTVSITQLPTLVRAMPITDSGSRKPIVSADLTWDCDHYKHEVTASGSATPQ